MHGPLLDGEVKGLQVLGGACSVERAAREAEADVLVDEEGDDVAGLGDGPAGAFHGEVDLAPSRVSHDLHIENSEGAGEMVGGDDVAKESFLVWKFHGAVEGEHAGHSVNLGMKPDLVAVANEEDRPDDGAAVLEDLVDAIGVEPVAEVPPSGRDRSPQRKKAPSSCPRRHKRRI